MLEKLKVLRAQWDGLKKKITPRTVQRLETFFNRLPNHTYDLITEAGAYDKMRRAHGDEDFFGPGAPIAWYRQLFHALGGFMGAFLASLYEPKYAIAAPFIIAALIALYEVQKSEGSARKRAFDVAAWFVGAYSGYIISILI